MPTSNKGDFFLVSFFKQFAMDDEKTWKKIILVQNLSVDISYFGECMKQLYGGDVKLSLTGYFVSFESSEKIPDSELDDFCEKEASKILSILSNHPCWGEKDGPEFADDYSLLD